MKKYILFCVAAMIMIFISCENSVTNEQNALIYQLPGCRSQGLLKSNYPESAPCFNYTFNKNLIVEFCVSGNCCPNENRFATNYRIYGDTILITVKDTAAHLCRCICSYVIRGEFQNLTKDEYIVECIREEDSVVVYVEAVRRKM